MTRLSARDYKRHSRRSLDLRRYREFGYGLLAGVVLAGLGFLYTGAKGHKAADPADLPRPDPHRAPPASASASAADNPAAKKYDFYQMLPNFEVVVPEKDKEVKRDLPAGAPIERPGVYVLQAGSYRNQADAERVRAQLALQGVQAKVQRVAVDADVWHRVRIGPITNLDELNRVRKQLKAAEVDALVIRVGD
ncbi:MAG TPA: SPOR domain-containing protein [Steroidobacteraceae bacterium]|nr:SPOR domain-containing protein [Steroidobacteraceae bacterium]